MHQNTNNSWGAPLSEEARYQQRPGSEQDSQGDSYTSDSDYDSDTEEDDDYAPLQMGAWGTQLTGEDKDDSAIQLPDWNAQPTNETPSLTFKADDWKKLCDPNVVIKSGIGSGNLHRKGANYKPVEEQHILNQRLKLGVPMPGKKKSRGSKPKSAKPKNAQPKNAQPKNVQPKSAKPKSTKPAKATYPPPPPPPINGPSLKAPSRPVLINPAWGTQLASTPFWEQSGARASKYAPTSQPPQQKPVTHQPTPPRQPSTPTTSSKWATEPLQEKYVAPTPAPAKPLGSSASKYASSQPTLPPVGYHGTISLFDTTPTPPPPERTILFRLEIELGAGIKAIMPVYETDDYTRLVKEFEAKHCLIISPEAELAFAEKIKLMVENYENKSAQR